MYRLELTKDELAFVIAAVTYLLVAAKDHGSGEHAAELQVILDKLIASLRAGD